MNTQKPLYGLWFENESGVGDFHREVDGRILGFITIAQVQYLADRLNDLLFCRDLDISYGVRQIPIEGNDYSGCVLRRNSYVEKLLGVSK
jgi:hypothetical protein